MRHLVHRDATVGINYAWRPTIPVQLLDIGGHVIEALRPEEVAVTLSADAPRQSDRAVQLRLRAAGGEMKVLAATFGIEARRHGNRLDQGRLPGTVLAD